MDNCPVWVQSLQFRAVRATPLSHLWRLNRWTHLVEARLCRWLLRARDLARSDTLLFTQEFLAEMLGLRRTSVSVVAHTLQQAGMIKYRRGKIEILNVEGLEESACECYGTVNSHYRALLGSPPK